MEHKTGKCTKCGSQHLDKGNIGGSFRYKSHKQGFFSEPVKDFEAVVCLDCGHVETYINVEKIKAKLKK